MNEKNGAGPLMRERREWLRQSWGWTVMVYGLGTSVWMWLLSSAVSLGAGMLAAGVWTLWWGWLTHWTFAISTTSGTVIHVGAPGGVWATARVFVRAVVLFGAAICWQYGTGAWLLSSRQGTLTSHKVFAVAIWAPVTEELAFRGFLLRAIVQARTGNSTILTMAWANGIIFSLHHLWNLFSFPVAYVILQCVVSFVAGSAAALHVLVFGERALLQVTALHCANNLFAMCYDPSVVQTRSLLMFLSVGGTVVSNALWIRECKAKLQDAS